ncbi:hypothetical protein N0V83_005267 [Neocucurbitaria cava]|uniref:Uncharacterized protein n=1 Tax=Neocucurbitaria cava TaxID=798079 RepID=A0A9W8YB72_9PLEO|nr:hypothetical protein N0V83_005267 [Neocucurbitaria cava]
MLPPTLPDPKNPGSPPRPRPRRRQVSLTIFHPNPWAPEPRPARYEDPPSMELDGMTHSRFSPHMHAAYRREPAGVIREGLARAGQSAGQSAAEAAQARGAAPANSLGIPATHPFLTGVVNPFLPAPPNPFAGPSPQGLDAAAWGRETEWDDFEQMYRAHLARQNPSVDHNASSRGAPALGSGVTQDEGGRGSSQGAGRIGRAGASGRVHTSPETWLGPLPPISVLDAIVDAIITAPIAAGTAPPPREEMREEMDEGMDEELDEEMDVDEDEAGDEQGDEEWEEDEGSL